jgi:molybdopterin-containing oxidoreductase family iron-sulfur binding subunit
MKAKDAVRAKGGEVYIRGVDNNMHCAVPEDGYITSCAEACPNGAIVFGDLNNPDHRVHKLVTGNANAFRLLERLGTDTAVYYISKREWVRRLGDNYLPDEQTQKPAQTLPRKH